MFKDNENYRRVSLDNIGNGAAVELFNHELQRVLANIDDPNTDWSKIRVITLQVSFAPSQARDFGNISISCQSKLAGLMPAASAVFFDRDGKKHLAFEPKQKQGELFDSGKVINMNNEGK